MTRQRLRDACLSVGAALSVAPAALADSPDGAPIGVEIRVPASGASVEALAWRNGDDFLVSPETLKTLGLNVKDNPAGGPVSISSVPGARYRFVESEEAVIIDCTSRCFPNQVVHSLASESLPVTSGNGAFLNIDLLANRVGAENTFAGQFDLGVFARHGFGGTSWTAGADGRGSVVRLDTTWNFDNAEARTRLSLGDSISDAGALGVPFRFGGIQYGTDFSLDPTFVRFPTPTFKGQAATPSVVDLYVNGALRARQDINAGPFEIANAPTVVGAGVAQVVVTDALGRQQAVNVPFYTSPSLLRPGLSDYSFALGAERNNYALESYDYRRGFVLGDYRRGLTDWATAEGRLELAQGAANIGGALSVAETHVGQVDFSLSASDGADGGGGLAGLTWSRRSDQLSFSAQIEATTARYKRLGDGDTLPKTRALATLGLDLGSYGSVAVTGTTSRMRDQSQVNTLNLSYSAPPLRFGSLSFSALVVDNGQTYTSFGLTFVRAFGGSRSAALTTEVDNGSVYGMAQAQSAPPPGIGSGWRASVSEGAVKRYDGAVTVHGGQYEASLEASQAAGVNGFRGQFSTALIWMDDTLLASRPVRDSFALVNVGAPDVGIYRDHQEIGRTGADGRLLITGLRAYDVNRVGVDVDDLPLNAELRADEVAVRPAARAGVVVRFPVKLGGAGEAHVVDADGKALPPGTILVRGADHARFPVGDGGRIYISGVNDTQTFTAEGAVRCKVTVSAATLTAGEFLRCGTPNA